MIHQHILSYFARGLVDLGSMADHLEGFPDQPVVDRIILTSKQRQLQVVALGPLGYSKDQVDLGIRLHRWVLIFMVYVFAHHWVLIRKANKIWIVLSQ